MRIERSDYKVTACDENQAGCSQMKKREREKETGEIKTTLETSMNKMSVINYNKEHCE